MIECVRPRWAAAIVSVMVDEDSTKCGDCGQTVDLSDANSEEAVVATLAKHQQEVHDAT